MGGENEMSSWHNDIICNSRSLKPYRDAIMANRLVGRVSDAKNSSSHHYHYHDNFHFRWNYFENDICSDLQ